MKKYTKIILHIHVHNAGKNEHILIPIFEFMREKKVRIYYYSYVEIHVQ